MKNKLLMTLLAASMVLSLTACGKSEVTSATEVSTEGETVTEEASTSEAETEEVKEDVLPEGMYFSELTNEPIDESLKNQRPIAAMVDNELTALPHFGLNEADIVYEMMNSTKNGRITRFMALVKDWGAIEQLGSIRSVRPTNILLAAEWNAVLCHDGGPFYNDPYFAEPYADHFSGIFSRVDNGKPREFTEYIMPGDLEKAFENSGVDVEYNEYYAGEHFKFAPKASPIDFSEDEAAIDAKKIELPFEHNGSYLEYNEETGMYDYFEYGDPHLDGETGVQLSFKNLLIQDCTFHQYDENGYLIYNCFDTGRAAWYITNGKAVKCTWVKTSATDQTRFYNSNNEEITINTGKTYIALVPDDSWSQLSIK